MGGIEVVVVVVWGVVNKLSHLKPVYLGGHWHLEKTVQTPSFRQPVILHDRNGWNWNWHKWPLKIFKLCLVTLKQNNYLACNYPNPGKHLHVKVPSFELEQIPPFWHWHGDAWSLQSWPVLPGPQTQT